jgi:hypothetical protein
MTEKEKKARLDESIQFFEGFINAVLPHAGTTEGLEEVKPMDIMKHYNLLRTELSKLCVDLD